MPAKKPARGPAAVQSTASPTGTSPFSERRYSAWQALGFAAVVIALVGGACLSGLIVGFAFGRATVPPVVALPGPAVGPQFPQETPPIVPPGETYLGVRYVVVTRELARREGLSVTDGALLRHVDAGGPADEAGLLRGDVVTHVDGIALDTRHDLRDLITAYAPGDSIELTFVRGERRITARVTLAAAPASE